MVGRERLAGRRLAGVRIDRRDLGLPLVGDRLHFGLVVAELGQVAERDEVQRCGTPSRLPCTPGSRAAPARGRTCRTGRRWRGAGPSARRWNSSRRVGFRRSTEIGPTAPTNAISSTPAKTRPTRKPNDTDHDASRSPYSRGRRASCWPSPAARFLLLRRQHRLGDRVRQRQRPLEPRDERQDDQEVQEIISRRDLAEHRG